MIERIQAYKASDGTVFASLEDVQRHDLAALLPVNDVLTPGLVANTFVTNRDKVLDILRLRRPSTETKVKTTGAKPKKVKAAEQPATSASN